MVELQTDIHYLTADEEEQYVVAQANAPLDKEGKFLGEKIDGRHGADFVHVFSKPRGLHGCFAETNGIDCDGADPVPGT